MSATAPTKPVPCACCHCADPDAQYVACLHCGRGHFLKVEITAGRLEWECRRCRHVNVITEQGHEVA